MAYCTKPKWSQQSIPVASQLKYPRGLFIDRHNALYVADRDNYRIQKFPAGSTGVGITVAGGNGPGNAHNQLSNPVDVFVDSAGSVFVADDNRIQRWSVNSTSGVTVVAPDAFYNRYQGLYVNEKAGEIYVSQGTFMGNEGRLMKYFLTNTSAAAGTRISSTLHSPRGLFVDRCSSAVYVANSYGNEIRKFELNGNDTKGTVMFFGLKNLNDVIADSYGNLYFVQEGPFHQGVGRRNVNDGSRSEMVIDASSMDFWYPESLVFDSQWNLYVADLVGGRVEKYLFEGGDLYC